LEKILLVGADFHEDRRTDGRADGRMDMTQLRVVFLNFATSPQHVIIPAPKRLPMQVCRRLEVELVWKHK